MKLAGLMLLLVGVAGSAFAGNAPEIDGNTAGAAVALLAGGLLILRSRRKK